MPNRDGQAEHMLRTPMRCVAVFHCLERPGATDRNLHFKYFQTFFQRAKVAVSHCDPGCKIRRNRIYFAFGSTALTAAWQDDERLSTFFERHSKAGMPPGLTPLQWAIKSLQQSDFSAAFCSSVAADTDATPATHVPDISKITDSNRRIFRRSSAIDPHGGFQHNPNSTGMEMSMGGNEVSHRMPARPAGQDACT